MKLDEHGLKWLIMAGNGLKADCDDFLFKTEYNYRILFCFQKNQNTKYRILFGSEKIRISNTNSSILSNYSNTED